MDKEIPVTKTIFCVVILLFAGIPFNPCSAGNHELIYGKVPDFIFEDIVVKNEYDDLDPLTDLRITVVIKEIRALDQIDRFDDPDFYVKIFVNEEEFKSKIWHNQKYVKDEWSTPPINVPDDQENITIKIQLWDWNAEIDKLCDISQNNNNFLNKCDVDLIYSLKTGHWNGDDFLKDLSGYGRLNGCDDGSVYEEEKDCELWFDILQNDYDCDNIPFWCETYVYGTDPTVDDTYLDHDLDNIPSMWEHKWGYSPVILDNHYELDFEKDSLNNIEEYLTSQWKSDPFRIDLFLELDQMEKEPDTEGFMMPATTKELLSDVYHKQNIVFHLDDGCMGGGEIIPFDTFTKRLELLKIYRDFFLHNNFDYWRRGVFRYGVIVNDFPSSAKAFVGEGCIINSNVRGINSFVITTSAIKSVKENTSNSLDFIYACYILHETGHTLGIDIFNPMGCDNFLATQPWMIGWWLYRNYESVMNYRYTHKILDYSDGSHGLRDYDDWSNLDFTWFEQAR